MTSRAATARICCEMVMSSKKRTCTLEKITNEFKEAASSIEPLRESAAVAAIDACDRS